MIAGSVRIRQGKIVELDPAAEKGDGPHLPEQIQGGGLLLTPGLIDIHTHGIEQFAYEAGPEQIVAASRKLARYGTTCVLPTLYRALSRPRLGELERLAAVLSTVEDVCMPGLHLEGPFLALPGAGAQTVPGDLGLLEELLAAAGGRVAAMSISPEVPNILPIIECLCQRGIVPFMTHTRATAEQTQRAIDAGAHHATHFYDVFPPPEETDPGVRPVGAVETILADPRCTVDFIADGVHVHPTAIKAAVAAKGPARVLLTTDSNIGAGLPPGIYDSPMGQIKTGEAARLHKPGSVGRRPGRQHLDHGSRDRESAGVARGGKRGQSPFAGTARRVLRTNGDCPLFPPRPAGRAGVGNGHQQHRAAAAADGQRFVASWLGCRPCALGAESGLVVRRPHLGGGPLRLLSKVGRVAWPRLRGHVTASRVNMPTASVGMAPNTLSTWAMGTSNIAQFLRLTAKGSLRVTRIADLVLWEQKPGSLQYPAAGWRAGVYAATL